MARILIVEDDPTNAELALLICKAAKHHVTVVENGVEALMLLDAVPFDLVITDVVMPRMDGITMAGLIRASGTSYANIPMIGMTAQADVASRQAMLEVGMDEVLTKPFRAQVLRDLIGKWLSSTDPSVTIIHRDDLRLIDRLDA